MTDLLRDLQGRPVPNLANAATMLRAHPDLLAKKIGDIDVLKAVVWFQRQGFPLIDKETVRDAMTLVAADAK